MKSPFATTVARLFLAAVLALLVPLANPTPVITDSSKGNVAETAPAQTAPDDFRPGEVLVLFEDDLPAALLTSALAAQDWSVKQHIPRFGIDVLTVPEGRELSTVAALRSDPRVEYAGLNHRVYTPEPRATSLPQMSGLAASTAGPVIPDDSLFFPWQWNLNNTGQLGGTPDADIDAPEAWDITTGSQEIIIAVLDSGVDLQHEDLVDKLWTNPDEIPGNGLDDDGNKKADDIYGWDFVNWDNEPQDDPPPFGVGTAVAGIAAAATNNDVGIAGVSWGARIMPLKVLESGAGWVSDVMTGIDYAVEKGARIVNMSFTTLRGDSVLQQIITEAHEQQGVLFVAMAGDCASGCFINDEYYVNPTFYPAAFDHVIAVGTTNQNDEREPNSGWGPRLDVMAPGELIPSSWWDPSRDNPHTYALFAPNEGSSAVATPHVSGLAALIWSVNPDLSPDEVEDIIKVSADKVGSEPYDDSGRNNLYGYGRINAETALRTTPHRLWLQPEELTFLADDERAPGCRRVSNWGTNASTWEAITTAQWLRVAGPRPTSLSPGLSLMPSWIDVCVAMENLPDYGSYSAVITATSTLTSTVNNSRTVPVSLVYQPSLSRAFLPTILKSYSAN